jgi:hypothetical protein
MRGGIWRRSPGRGGVPPRIVVARRPSVKLCTTTARVLIVKIRAKTTRTPYVAGGSLEHDVFLRLLFNYQT